MEGNYHLSSKKHLFKNMKAYYEAWGKPVLDVLPETFHIENGVRDPAILDFEKRYNEIAEQIKEQKRELNMSDDSTFSGSA